MLFHGSFADAKLHGDALVEISVDHSLQDLLLPRRELSQTRFDFGLLCGVDSKSLVQGKSILNAMQYLLAIGRFSMK
jgi:hypothetical protein